MIGITFGVMKALLYWIGLKKAIAKIRKTTPFWMHLRCYSFISLLYIANIACLYIMHVVYLLAMLPSRTTAYYKCSVLIFLPLAWVYLGPLQHQRWSIM